MYFGSVRFFKHLITTVVIILILGLATLLCLAVLQLRRAEADAAEYKKQADASSATLTALVSGEGKDTLTAEQVYAVITNLGANKREIINLLYVSDKNDFDDVFDMAYNREGGIPTKPPEPGASDVPDLKNPEDGSDLKAADDLGNIGGMYSLEASKDDKAEPDAAASGYAALYPEMVVEGAAPSAVEDKDTIYMTFDDGPSEYTEDILYYLKKNDVKATFFVIPTQTSGEKLRLIQNDGHAIGIHTLTHDYKKIYASVEAYLEDFHAAWQLLYEQTGIKAEIFRFPGGSINDYNKDTAKDIIAEMTRRGFVYFDWNVDSEESIDATWNRLYDNIRAETAEPARSIVLMHDRPGGKMTVLVLDDILQYLKSDPRNFKFAPLSRAVRPMHFGNP